MPLHVFRHVEANQLDAHRERELASDLGLADAGGAREQERADGPPLVAEARACHLDRGRERADRAVLTEDHELEIALDVAQRIAIGGRHVFRRNPRDLRDDGLDELDVDDARPRSLGLQPAVRAGLVDDVDRLVRQLPVVDVLADSSAAALSASSEYAIPWCSSKRVFSPRRISTVSCTDGS